MFNAREIELMLNGLEMAIKSNLRMAAKPGQMEVLQKEYRKLADELQILKSKVQTVGAKK